MVSATYRGDESISGLDWAMDHGWGCVIRMS